MNKTILYSILSGLTGLVIGGLAVNKYKEREFDKVVDNIYNECYTAAREDIAESMATPNSDPKQEFTPEQKKLHKGIVELYAKPDLGTAYNSLKEAANKTVDITKKEDTIPEQDEEDLEEDDDHIFDPTESEDGPPSRLISSNEFVETCVHYNKIDLFYYKKDKIFTDEDDQLFDFTEYSESMKIFEGAQGDSIIIRNNYNEIDFFIYVLDQAYQEILAETHKEREKRISKRKIYRDNDN